MDAADSRDLPPLPIPDAITRPFWEAAQRGVLLIQRCTRCGSHQHYPRPVCLACSDGEPEWVEASGTGVVHTFTVTYRNDTPAFADSVPYVFAIIDLAEGVRMPGNVLTDDPEAVRIGMPVEVAFVPVTGDVTLPQWRPLPAPETETEQ